MYTAIYAKQAQSGEGMYDFKLIDTEAHIRDITLPERIFKGGAEIDREFSFHIAYGKNVVRAYEVKETDEERFIILSITGQNR
ncbi:MAG: hypothetical protein ACP5D2_04250 [Candidatus Nanoarchaeia archaeon]